MTLQLLKLEVEKHLQRIRNLLPDGYVLTLLARNETNPEGYLLFTRDELTAVMVTIAKALEREPGAGG